MDRVFLREFMENMYEDVTAEVVRDNSAYEKLRVQYMDMEREFYQQLIELSPELAQMHDELSEVFGKLQRISDTELYLRGAEDRERMLR